MTETQEKKQQPFWHQGRTALCDLPRIRKGLTSLLKQDPRLAAAHARGGALNWKQQPGGFEGLARIVISQQISTLAATRLIERAEEGLNGLTPPAFVKASEQKLRALGLSGQKAAACQGLARAILDGAFDPEDLDGMSDDEALEALTALRGIGPWSAHMYLMFCLGRPDIWPAGDMGVQKGVQAICGLATRPTAAQTRALGADWSPYRTAACLIAWRVSG